MSSEELLRQLNIEDSFASEDDISEASFAVPEQDMEVEIEEAKQDKSKEDKTDEVEDSSFEQELYEEETNKKNPSPKRTKEPRQIDRKARVKRLKRLIVSVAALLLIVPNILCVFTLSKVHYLTEKLNDMDYLLNIMATEVSTSLANEATVHETVPVEVAQPNAAIPEDTASEVTVLYLDGTEEQEIAEETEIPESSVSKRVYLTFDDGPSQNTDAILDILAEYNVKATFFVNAHDGYEETYQRIVEEGHSIGMHSYDHVFRNVYADLDSFVADYEKIHQYIYDITGVDSNLYRFPGGSSNRVSQMNMQDAIQYLTENGIIYVDWNVSSKDASSTLLPAEQIVSNVLGQIDASSYQTNVVLMHDAGVKTTTVEALPIILEALKAREDIEILAITESTPKVVHVDYENR